MKVNWIPCPDTQGLRQFAISLSWALPLLLMGLLPWWFDYAWSYYPLVIPAILLPLAWLKPQWLQPFYRVWMLVFGFLGKINTMILLTLVFVLLITPLGFAARHLGKLHYRKRGVGHGSGDSKSSPQSNWQAPSHLPQVHNLKEPF